MTTQKNQIRGSSISCWGRFGHSQCCWSRAFHWISSMPSRLRELGWRFPLNFLHAYCFRSGSRMVAINNGLLALAQPLLPSLSLCSLLIPLSDISLLLWYFIWRIISKLFTRWDCFTLVQIWSHFNLLFFQPLSILTGTHVNCHALFPSIYFIQGRKENLRPPSCRLSVLTSVDVLIIVTVSFTCPKNCFVPISFPVQSNPVNGGQALTTSSKSHIRGNGSSLILFRGHIFRLQ